MGRLIFIPLMTIGIIYIIVNAESRRTIKTHDTVTGKIYTISYHDFRDE